MFSKGIASKEYLLLASAGVFPTPKKFGKQTVESVPQLRVTVGWNSSKGLDWSWANSGGFSRSPEELVTIGSPLAGLENLHRRGHDPCKGEKRDVRIGESSRQISTCVIQG